MKIIAIGGPPGSGKSTFMKRLMKEIGYPEGHKSEMVYDLIPAHKSPDGKILVLGKYDPDVGTFGGTDKMSMAVMPKAIEFLKTKPADIVIFEGDRLFSSKFLEYCVENHETLIINLQVSLAERDNRCKDRGSDQNREWLNGRETKVANILTNFMLSDNIETFVHEKPEHVDPIIERIVEFIA